MYKAFIKVFNSIFGIFQISKEQAQAETAFMANILLAGGFIEILDGRNLSEGQDPNSAKLTKNNYKPLKVIPVR